MKFRLILFIALVLKGVVCMAGDFVPGRGVNIAHWLSQCYYKDIPKSEFVTADDFKEIARQGFDHVRLPIDEKELWNADGTRNKEVFGILHAGIRNAIKNGLKVVVDLHIVHAHDFNAGAEGRTNSLWSSEKDQEHLCSLWKDLSDELHEYGNDDVAYEIMNEPVAPDHEAWNKLVAKVYGVIRSREKSRTIVVGSNMWQQTATFEHLRVPAGDDNIILSFHFYEPYFFTHYRAGWTEQKDFGGTVHYPGEIVTAEELAAMTGRDRQLAEGWVTVWDRQRIKDNVMKAKKKADELGLGLYCGEFGVYSRVPEADALRWLGDLTGVLDELGISWALWNYKDGGGFGLRDMRTGEWHTRFVDTLMHR